MTQFSHLLTAALTILKDDPPGLNRDEPPPKISKLAIAAVAEEDRYDTVVKVICYRCCDDDIDISSSTKLREVVDGVLKAITFSRKEEVKAWELELTSCEHILCLSQGNSDSMQVEQLSHCSQCALKENLWLCLQCGNVGCGRSQFGGVGGNSHALAHANDSTHTVAVKLNSILPEGSADVFCYACGEERIDPDLGTHLAHWGIMVAEQRKTEKSLTEMQIEHNLNWEFTMTTNDGMDLKPIFGPGFTGLRNLGNSCYLASVLQCLFSLKEFERRYFKPREQPPAVSLPAEDVETQLRKIADGLISGRYSVPNSDTVAHTDSQDLAYQRGLSPGMLKHLIGRGHDEFSTMRQQDAFELLLHLFKLISFNKHSEDPNPVSSFRFALEQRLQCLSCGKVRYKVDEQDNISVPVPIRRLKAENRESENESNPAASNFERVSIEECLDIFTGEEIVELTCSGCGSQKGFRKRSLFKTFPQNLIVNARRFELMNWVPTKLDIPVEVSDEPLALNKYLSPGHQEGEALLEDEPSPEKVEFQPNKEAVNMLLSMGFPEIRVIKALHATGNTDTDDALNWLLAHMDDPDIDNPSTLMESGSGGESGTSENEAKIDQLIDMGIERSKALRALKETSGDINRAIDWVFSHLNDSTSCTDEQVSKGAAELPGVSDVSPLFQLHSIICHKGASVHTGHYVAFVRKQIPDGTGDHWVLFNDEKVVEAGDIGEMKQFAYIYFFRRVSETV
ncbi:ubiquitin C-terminal hydrolase Ubp14 [Emydomyces testavorans]|uniref:Ubiquitin carboxyl-terminal hydrolase n=1 Tax=Emydomyces testavorans TaxID=2070801 RepID=A0AAF0IGA2_9EURO|nr:ubiquitin C-terminal hydrolase Ubp14 [Emydomyces testavorans]